MSHLRAPAKINLGLKIVGVRKDGYHLLESLFAPISLYDEISLKPRAGCEGADNVSYVISGRVTKIENDTVSRALAAFREWVPETPKYEVIIQKAIPMGAGLGGGSSDAGTILRHLYQAHAQTKMSAELVKLALKIGADVPFFLSPRPAWVTGIGERIQHIEIEPLTLLVCKPPFSISTSEAFAWFDEAVAKTNPQLTHLGLDANSLTGTEVSRRQAAQRESSMTVRQVIEILENDLEKAVETRHPEIQKMRLALRHWGALGSLMSGTGSSVYGLFRNTAEAVAAREKLKPRYTSTYSFFICETIGTET